MFVTPKVSEIKTRREKMMYSQHQLSVKAGLGGCSISRIESRKTTKIHPLRAKAIAEALGCELEEVFIVK